jgi:hypothetical protein
MKQASGSEVAINIDIETTPIKGYVWGMYEENVLEVVEDSIILSAAIHEIGGDTRIYALPNYKGYKKGSLDDKKLVKDLWDELNRADVIIGHNLDQFDLKKLNARFAFHRMGPPAPYKTIDTKKVAKKYFRFDSNKLDHLARYLGIGRKLPTRGKDTWLECMEGDKAAWKEMAEYNIHDVMLDNDVYEVLSPWISKTQEKTTLIGDDMICTRVGCGSKRLQKRGTQKGGKQQRYQCVDCGKWGHRPIINN